MVAELDGLNASAVAEACTVSVLLLQMREKNAGKYAFCTVTVTWGLMPKFGVTVLE
jgi:hypothetical protein